MPDFAIASAGSLGEDEEHFTVFQPSQAFLESSQANAFAIDGNGIQGID